MSNILARVLAGMIVAAFLWVVHFLITRLKSDGSTIKGRVARLGGLGRRPAEEQDRLDKVDGQPPMSDGAEEQGDERPDMTQGE